MPDRDVTGKSLDARIRRLELWRAYEQGQFELRTQTLKEIETDLSALRNDVRKVSNEVRNIETADEVADRVAKTVDNNRLSTFTRREKRIGLTIGVGMFLLQIVAVGRTWFT